MKLTIWKYKLKPEDCNFIQMPEDAEILSIHTQHGDPCMWVLVNPENPLEERIFEIFGTGYSIPVNMSTERKFIGTFLVENTHLVFHVFERIV